MQLLSYARDHYLGPKSEIAFQKDLYLLKLIQKQLSRYTKKHCLNYRLFLNNIILFFNVFETFPAKVILFDVFSEQYHSILYTFLYHLNFIAENEFPHLDLNKEVSIQIQIILTH